MAVCKNPINFNKLESGKKYNVFEETEDKLVLTAWFCCETQGRTAQVYLTFRKDKPDPEEEWGTKTNGPDKPNMCNSWMYGLFDKADPDGDYELIPAYVVVPPQDSVGAKYRYCLVEEGGKRRKRKTRRRRSGTRRHRRR